MSPYRHAAWAVLATSIAILLAALILGDMFRIGAILALSGGVIGLLLLDGRYVQGMWRVAPLAAYVMAWLGFTALRAFADDVGLPNRGELAASIDRVIGLGVIPSDRLQSALFVPGEIGIIDQAAMSIHASYFLVPHILAIVLWIVSRHRNTNHFNVYLLGTTAVLALGLLVYVLVPTSPPWLQTLGDDGSDVTRIVYATNMGGDVSGDQVYAVVTDPNPIAAMPSLHTAITVLLAWVAWQSHRRAGQIFTIYAIAMGVALVYLGEHFVVDVVAGLALTTTVIVGLRRFAVSATAPDVTTPSPAQRVPGHGVPAKRGLSTATRVGSSELSRVDQDR